MTQVAGTHSNTQEALNAIETATSIANKNVKDIIYGYSSAVAKVLHISDDHKSSPEHEQLIADITQQTSTPDTARIANTRGEIGRVQSMVEKRKCLTGVEKRSIENEFEELIDDWQKKATVASSRELITMVVQLHKTIKNLPEAIDWSTIKTKTITPVKEGETPMIEVESPVDGVELEFGQGRTITLKSGTIQYPVPHIQTHKKAKTQATETITLCDPNEPNNKSLKDPRTIIWDIEPNKLKIEEPDISYPKKIKVGDKMKFTLNNPVSGAKMVATETISGDNQRFDASQSKTFEFDKLDTSLPTPTGTKKTIEVTMIDENFPGSPSSKKTLEIEIEAKEMDFDKLNVDPNLEIKEGEVPTIPLMRGVKEAMADVRVGGASVIDSGSQKLSGGDQGLNLDATKVGPGGSVINTDNVNKKPIYLDIIVTDPHYPTNQVRKRVKLDIKPSKLAIEEPLVQEATFVHGTNGAKMTVNQTTPGTTIILKDGTGRVISQTAVKAQAGSTEIPLKPDITRDPQKLTGIIAVATNENEPYNENKSTAPVDILVKMDFDKLSIPKADINVKFDEKKPKINIHGGTKNARIYGEGNEYLGQIMSNGDNSFIADLGTNPDATEPKYDAKKPGEYTCNLRIVDANDVTNTKTIPVKFIVKPKELILSSSPNIEPATIKTQIGKTDALVYTVKDAQAGEEIVVKGPNGFEYIQKIPDGLIPTPPATGIDYPISLSGLDTAEKGVKPLTFMRRDPNDHTKCSPVKSVSYEVKDKDALKIKEDINKPKVGKVEVEHNATEVIATLENPVPGSKVTIAGGGITKTIIVPHDYAPSLAPAPTPPATTPLVGTLLNPFTIKLDGFPTKEADKVTNMTVTISDPSDENIKSSSAFDIQVGHDHLHEHHSYRLDEQSLRDAKSGGTYTVYEDGTAETYKVSSSKRWLRMGWKAEVPVLKGEKPKNITARTKTNLIEAVRAHCKDLEKRAHAKSHGNHEDHGNESHDKKEHKEGGDHEKGEKKEGESHDKKEGHSEDHPESHSTEKKGFFKRIGGWIDTPFKWVWKNTPKFIKVPLAGTAKVVKDSIITGGVLGAGSSLLGVAGLGTASVFTAGLIVPGMLGAASISTIYRLMKVTGWAKKLGIEGNSEDGGDHAHPPAGDHAHPPKAH